MYSDILTVGSDQVHMIYDHLHRNKIGAVPIILKSPSSVPAALELTGAPLFHERVTIVRWSPEKIRDNGFPDYMWGWYANTSSSFNDISLRYPCTSVRSGAFEPYREGRSVVFYGLPMGTFRDPGLEQFIYQLCHDFDVVSLSEAIRYQASNGARRLVDVIFEKKEDAQAVCDLYNNISYRGCRITVGIRRPPMKYLGASWDPGHNRAHNRPRDLGSAKNTNFESVRNPPIRHHQPMYT